VVEKLLPASLACCLALPAAVSAQNPPRQPVRVMASVGEVTDTRSTGSFFSECKVELKFTGDAAADAQSVRKIRITEAQDELGRDLVKADQDSPSAFFDPARSGGALKAELKLRNPSRNATVIKVLKGEAEFFSPTEANGGILRISNILRHPAEPVQNPVLAKYKIELIYLTKESYEAKKKELEQKSGGGTGGQLGAAFGELFKGMFGGMISDSKNSVQLYTHDPEKRIVGIGLQDGQGKRLPTNGSMTGNGFRQINLKSPPPDDMQVVVFLATPESVSVYPFEIQNIPLP
jgi:hypothetical protein